jgi:uroporphyrinogen-III synthase
MSRLATPRALVLRPEPGNARTADRLIAAGMDVIRLPLFVAAPVAWTAVDPDRYDALLVTSANAIRHAGPGLDAVRHLPVVAVGQETAAVARQAGLHVTAVGASDAAAALVIAHRSGFARPLHLAGRDYRPVGVATVVVYASDAVMVPAGAMAAAMDGLALIHSPRAARRFAELVDRDALDRSRIGVVALSPAVLAAAGDGWASAVAAAVPTDAALVALAAACR